MLEIFLTRVFPQNLPFSSLTGVHMCNTALLEAKRMSNNFITSAQSEIRVGASSVFPGTKKPMRMHVAGINVVSRT